jgi:cytochrome oxidase Cu insertion factor (SCO1/SenC/PrrC family)
VKPWKLSGRRWHIRAAHVGAAGYLIDHTARTYAINALGEWRLTYPFGMETEKIIQDIQHLLKEK